MTHVLKQEQDKIWEVIEMLMKMDKERAGVILKTAVERTLRLFGMSARTLEFLDFKLDNPEDLRMLKQIEMQMLESFEQRPSDLTYKYVIDYIEQLSQMAKGHPNSARRKLMTSLLIGQKRGQRALRFRGSRPFEHTLPVTVIGKGDKDFYKPSEVAKKLGLSDQTIRRLCEDGKFPGSYRTDGGHWRIPQEDFVTTPEQDEVAELVFNRIDAKNREAGEVDEFDL